MKETGNFVRNPSIPGKIQGQITRILPSIIHRLNPFAREILKLSCDSKFSKHATQEAKRSSTDRSRLERKKNSRSYFFEIMSAFHRSGDKIFDRPEAGAARES